MGLSLSGLGKSLQDILGGVGGGIEHLIGGAGQAIGNEVGQLPQQVNNAVSDVSHIFAPRPTTNVSLPPPPPAAPNFVENLLNGALNPEQTLASRGAATTLGPTLLSGVQGFTRSVPQVGLSLVAPNKTYTPGSKAEKLIFGNTPVQSIEAGVGSTYANHPNLPAPLRVGLAGAYGAGQLVGDLPVVGGAAKAVKTGAEALDVGGAIDKANTALGERGSVPLPGKNPGTNPEINTIRAHPENGVQLPVKAEVAPKLVRLYHGTSDDVNLSDLKAGQETGLGRGQDRRLLYASDNSDVAKEYAMGRGIKAGGGNPNVMEFNFGGKILNHNSATYTNDLRSLIENPDFKNLSVRSRNQLTNIYNHGDPVDTLSGAVLESNPELTDYLASHGVDAVKFSHATFGGKLNPRDSSQTVILNPQKILRPQVPTPAPAPASKETSIIRAQKAVSQGTNPANYEDYVAQAKAEGVEPGVTQAQWDKVFKSPAEIAAPDEAGRLMSAKNNPLKTTINSVEPGDYGAAIANSQQASRPVETAAQLWENSMRRLSKPEKANFWHSVEDPTNPSYSANLKDAISKWRQGANQAHATDMALGGKSGYIQNYARHPWDLTGWEDVPQPTTVKGDFTGLSRTPRKYATIAEGEAAGLKLGTDPIAEGRAYFGAASSQLRKAALSQGLEQADRLEEIKPHTLDLGYGKTVPLSETGMQASRGLFPHIPSKNLVVKGLRTVNTGIKSTILSLGQFHTINIGALRAAPSLLAKGHPVAAGKGLYRMFRGAFGSKYADRVIGNALKDGTVEKAAKIGMPYGGSGYNTEGTFLKHGVGSRTVFGKQIPMMHDQVARSIIHDLERKGISLDSPQARTAGLAGAHMMGEINYELENISPKLRQGLTDTLLAGQFTPSKFKQVGTALTKGGVGGSYARANVVANVAATTAVIAGLGYITKQKSDDLKDMLLRALVNPAVPTPLKDAKGNTQDLRLPGTDVSDIMKLLGVTVVRGTDGHLGINWSPQNIPGTVTDFLRARLGPLTGGAVKLATNTTYANKPLFDPNAPAGTKAEQALTSLVTGDLPIGAQGLAYTDTVKKHLPGPVQEILNAQTPGSNPVLKSVGSSFGLTPSTDTTVGKGQQTTQYFNELDKAKQGLNSQETIAINLFTGSKKNPVTGKYDVMPSVEDSPVKAGVLLQNPKVIDHLITMNQNLAANGQQVDPLWKQSKAQITAYLQYQTINKNNTQGLTDWHQKNPWYQQLEQDRSAFFNSLPPGDPNKPANPIAPVVTTPEVDGLLQKYGTMTDPTQRAQFLGANPALTTYMDQQAERTNQVLKAQGLAPLKPYPAADAETSSYTSAYMNGDKAQRAALRTGNPAGFQKMQAYLENVDEYEVAKNGALDQLQGQTPNQSLLKGINSLSNYDIVTNPDGSLSLKYGSVNPGAPSYGSVAIAPQAGSSVSGGSNGYAAGYAKAKSFATASSNARKIRMAGKASEKRAHKVYMNEKNKLNLGSARLRVAKVKAPYYPETGQKNFKRSRPKVSIKRAS